MTAPTTTKSGSTLEAPAFRSGALWMLAAPIGLTCLPGLAVDALPAPEASFSAGLLIILLAGLAIEVVAVTRPARSFSDIFFPADAVLVFGLAFASPLVVLAGRLIATATADGLHRRHPTKVAFNAALCAAETLGAAAVYRVILQGGSVTSPLGILAAVAAIAVSLCIGMGMMAAIHALHSDKVSPGAFRTMAGLSAAALAAGIGLVFAVSALAG